MINSTKWSRALFFVPFILLSVISCVNETEGGNGSDEPANYVLEKEPKKDYLITIETSMGTMHAVLYDETPLHKANFIALAKKGLYDSTIFHRVINQFMIQGGDVELKMQEKGITDESVKKELIPAEFMKKYFHKKGTLAAARTGDNVNPEKKSSWCQFYISQGKKYKEDELNIDQSVFNNTLTQFFQDERNKEYYDSLQVYQQKGQEAYVKYLTSLIPRCEELYGVKMRKEVPAERLEAYTTLGGIPHLDDEYTVFGEIIDGFEVLDKIAAVPTAPGDKPLEDITMKVTVEYLKKKKITKEYGYIYN